MIHGVYIEFRKEDETSAKIWFSVKDERDTDVARLKALKYAERKAARVESFTGEFWILRSRRFERAEDFRAERRGFESAKAMQKELDRRAGIR